MTAPIIYTPSNLARVYANVQSFADEVVRRFGPRQISTYAPGHDPSAQAALDIFGTHTELRAIALWAASDEVYARYGIRYHITNLDGRAGGDIWNPSIVKAWRAMRDRGGITANHIDHDHFSFNNGGAPPDPQPGDDDMTDAQFNRMMDVGFGYLHAKQDVTNKLLADLLKAQGQEVDIERMELDALQRIADQP